VPDAGADQYPLTGVTSLVVGYQFACGLTASGIIDCWGSVAVGSQTVPEATQYTSGSQPYTGVTALTAYGEDWSGLRYTTSTGAYIQGNQSVTPYCQ
jgi:hypothetical protein